MFRMKHTKQVNKSNSIPQSWSQVSVTIAGARADGAVQEAEERNKQVTFKNCAPFTICISQINNTQLHNEEYLDIVIPKYNLINYSNNYAKKKSGRL